MLTSEWCNTMVQKCLDANDIAGVKAYSELASLWAKREKEMAAKSACVCGKSETGACVGRCATGE